MAAFGAAPTPVRLPSPAPYALVGAVRPRRRRTRSSAPFLTRQCLDRRIGDLDTLNTELSAWQNATNADQRQVDWQFTTHDARIKLRNLYPKH
ncbi:hypothetical protein ACWEP4_12965 [Streptomyces sp. NPDC004227]